MLTTMGYFNENNKEDGVVVSWAVKDPIIGLGKSTIRCFRLPPAVAAIETRPYYWKQM
jgi:hypothetical protein